MNKKKLYITISIILVIVLSCSTFLMKISHGKITTSKPIELQQLNLKTNVSSIVQNLNPVITKNTIVINDKENQLLCTFQDREKAMDEVKKQDKEFLQQMKEKWNLNTLSSGNWKTYKQHLDQYAGGKLPDNLGEDKYDEQRLQLEGFLGIYGNDELNKKTIKYINFINLLLKTKIVHQVSLDPVVSNLPFDTPILK